MKKGKQMKDKDLFQKIEQFDDYPIGYESNVNTQRRLIEDLLNSSNSNFQPVCSTSETASIHIQHY